MFKWIRGWLAEWHQMFQPSEERKYFERELLMRPPSTDEQWTCVYKECGRDRTRRIVRSLEQASNWPPDRLLPTDSLDFLFHGAANEEMPFGLFRSDVRREFGIRVTMEDIATKLSQNQRTLHGLIRLIVTLSRK